MEGAAANALSGFLTNIGTVITSATGWIFRVWFFSRRAGMGAGGAPQTDVGAPALTLSIVPPRRFYICFILSPPFSFFVG